MLRADLPVPPGFCVTTPAYRRVVGDRLAESIVALTASATSAQQRPAPSDRPRRPGARRPGPSRRRALPGARRRRTGGGPLLGHRRGPARSQLRGSAGHLSQRRGDRRRAGRHPPMLGLAVDRAGRQLPHHPGHRPRRGRSGGGRAAHGRRRRGRGDVHRQSRHRQPAAAGRRRQSRVGRVRRVRIGQPGPLRPRRQHRHSGRGDGGRQAHRRPVGGRWRHPDRGHGRLGRTLPDHRPAPLPHRVSPPP